MRSLKDKKGFTLIELMVVIVILGILAILAIPKFTAVTAKAKMSEVPGILSSYEHAQMAYIAETGTYGDVNSLTFESPSSKWFTYEEKTPADDNDFQAEAKNDVGAFSSGSAVWTEYSGGNFTHDATAADKAAAQKYIPNFF